MKYILQLSISFFFSNRLTFYIFCYWPLLIVFFFCLSLVLIYVRSLYNHINLINFSAVFVEFIEAFLINFL
ncbi:ATPase 6 (plasmid) [Borreliella burgdorferi WI91-23]|nr:ATPase 6 [Borreliella burgdorferi WI91-23]